MKNCKLIIAILATFLVGACTSEPSDDLQDSIVESTPESDGSDNPAALFDPSNSVIPFPNNLLFSGSVDGTLNIPVDDEDDLSDPQVALNALDGFSTVAPMSTGFSTAIDSATVNGTSVRLYKVTLSGAGGAVVAIDSQLTFGIPGSGADYFAAVSSVDTSQSTLAILPLEPLEESESYMVVITDDLMTTDGDSFGPSVTYRLIKNLPDALVFDDPTLPGALQSLDATELATFEGLRQIVNVGEATVAASDATLEVPDIINSWSFTTQSIGDVLTAVRTSIRAGGVPATTLGDSGADSPLGAADIYVGSLQVPYYLTAATGVNDPTPLSSFWEGAGGSHLTQYNTAAVSTSTQTIPLMVSVPKAGGPLFPVTIYQHGITTNRATMLAIADSLAAAGIAVVAIDMPMHGLTNNETDGTEAFYEAAGVSERTFDLDLVTQDGDGNITAATPDGTTDTSGRHYINLTNLRNSRDNLRQSVSDLFALAYAIDNLTDTGINSITFDNTNIDFVGHSLGAIVGTTFAALEPTVQDTVLAFGGASVPKILDGSASFGPSIAAGLAANGVDKGTADYESFLGAAQTVVDTVDAVNHGEALADKGEGILFFEIVGGNTALSDLVVPNTVPDGNDSSGTVAAPLAGTEPLLELMDLEQTNADVIEANTQNSVKFVSGSHSSLLDPTPDAAVTTEMQTQMATFLGASGGFVDVTDDSLLQAP